MVLTKRKDVLRRGANIRQDTKGFSNGIFQRQCDPHDGMKEKPLLQQRYPHYVISLRESADSKAIKPTAETTEPAHLR